MKFPKILKYELMNIARNRWLFFYTAIIAGITLTVLKISGDVSRTVLTLSSVLVVLVPLVSSIFTALYWYYNERFTELMLTQPIPRKSILWMRWLALNMTLSLSFTVGIIFPMIFMGQLTSALVLVIVCGIFLTMAFVGLTVFFCAKFIDRMKGVGLVLGLWLYLVLVHDSLILLLLIALKDYPMDFPGAIFGVLNPIGLVRVVLLMAQNAALLLGHTGMVVRNILTTMAGMWISVILGIMWITIPMFMAHRVWKRRDF